MRTLKVSVERKTFWVSFEGGIGGRWCSITEHSKGFAFVLGFEKEEVSWLIEQMTKAIELKVFMGFNRKFRGKNSVHLLEVGFNEHGRYIRLSEFASRRKSAFLVIPEGDNGRGWELMKEALYSMLAVPSSGFDEKGRQSREGRNLHKFAGPLQRSFVNVVKEERPRRGGLVSVGRWARAMVCECHDDSVNWAEVGWAMARRLGHKGVTVVPFAGGKGLFFVETLEEAVSLHKSRFIKIKGGFTVLLRRWLPKENSEIEEKFKEGWIDLRGLPFHLWSEVHLKKIMEQWEAVTEIDWRTLKLFYLSKARVRVVMKERSVLPALIEVLDGGWDFTVSVTVARKEDGMQVREMGESTQHLAEAHTGTVGRKREEEDRSTVGKGTSAGAVGRTMEWRGGQKAENAPGRTRGTNRTTVGNSWPPTSFS